MNPIIVAALVVGAATVSITVTPVNDAPAAALEFPLDPPTEKQLLDGAWDDAGRWAQAWAAVDVGWELVVWHLEGMFGHVEQGVDKEGRPTLRVSPRRFVVSPL